MRCAPDSFVGVGKRGRHHAGHGITDELQALLLISIYTAECYYVQDAAKETYQGCSSCAERISQSLLFSLQ